MKQAINYALPGMFLLVVTFACIVAMYIPEKVSMDAFQALHYPDHPAPHNALTTLIVSIIFFAIGYGGYRLVIKTGMRILPFDTFYSLGFLIQAAFAAFLLVSIIDGNSRSLGSATLVLLGLVAPLSVSKLYQLAQ